MKENNTNTNSHLKLHEYIRMYKPYLWEECISKVTFVSIITLDEFKDIEVGIIPERLQKPYFTEAIIKYFQQQHSQERKIR